MNVKMMSFIISSTIVANSFTGVCYSKGLKKIPSENSKTESIRYNKFVDTKTHGILNSFKNVFNNKTPDGVSTKEYSWYFQPKNDNTPPDGPKETNQLISKYDCFHLGDTSKKVLYLTFDEGYEAGYTAPILDVLKKHNVKAAFFVVKPYITSSPDIIKRMVTEGHLVCNHSNHHLSMASIKDEEKFDKELSDVEDAFEGITHKKMSKYFRPPMGKYSELSLLYTKNYGYKTIFWSFAYMDWLTDKQPSHEDAKKRIMQRTHNGGIMLLHAVSKTNAEILDDVITQWEKQGYVLKSLDELPIKN
ncbi:delta-lactam-biosynthetic de-N-acetylase [Clostridium estertheticum]|uniref:delta-lactam-biosynthetic de-N-acetylase n=1 Tax=Clostridium estertheticum TaxID=238834 RepID=UPI001C7D4316|nr:delta-lactam-biosynthetic de-N-acetylase [Clostridium estertheticum]MBX4266962.1 delta-lactam-biosynthetic de-N-acetylase [Clostridium estertheticum]MBX4271411.1 delta-lactam-biosynthetic de-N-acetylase [Clostridium estertheticum]WLC78806.1 delta-lactam-biosynthetic de-N-acetylase [Clostridium estertheticum]WLC89828.1 delta-lactam-biosynthetic de-N-acetylase [Clostridium estertheticum]